MRDLSFGLLAGEAFGFAKHHIKDAAILGLPALIVAVISGWLVSQQQMGLLWLVGILALFAATYAQYGLVHKALGMGPAPRRFTMSHLRLLGGNILMALLLAMIAIVIIGTMMFTGLATILGAAGAGATANDLGTALQGMGLGSAILALVLLVGGIGFLVWFSVRLSGFAGATVAEDKIYLLSSLPMTKGQVWPLLAMTVVIFLATILAGIVLSVITWPILGAEMTNSIMDVIKSGEATATEPVPLSGTQMLVSSVADWLVTYLISMPLWAGLTASVYRHRKEALHQDTPPRDA